MESTIYFSGVDMIDQTPVLDIKPYIPQYDNPGLSIPFDDSIGNISNLSDLSLRETDSLMNVSSLNSLSLNDASIQDDFPDNLNVRIMDGEENGERAQAVVGASSAARPNTNINLEDTYHESR